MAQTTRLPLGELIRDTASPLTGNANDYDALLQLIGDAPVVLLGEASHGTHEFYLAEAMDDMRLERAIGVIYRPETERVSHYFEARLPQQFDAVIHLDQTRAVEPLDPDAGWDQGEPPETFPTGL